MTVDPEKVAALIAEIAQEEIVARYGRLSADEIRPKSGPNDLVTAVDEATEHALRKALYGIAPGAAFIGEELAARDPSVGDALRGDGAFWIVDPLDGTRNFINGVDEFGVIVAFVENGETCCGWIYAAPESACAVAEKGAGARWRGEPIIVALSDRDRPYGLRSIGLLPADRQERMRANLKAHFKSRPSHCSAYAYIHLAHRRYDFKISSRIHPWDHAAGALLVEEAGGRAAYLDDGEAYAPAPSVNKALLVSAPGCNWGDIAGKLRN